MKLISFAKISTQTHEFPKVRVLDYGMGNGFFALALKSFLVDVSGAEFSLERIKFGNENGIKSFHVNENLPKNYFDLINTEQVMEHVPYPRELLKRLVESLKVGGILKISVPHSRSLEKKDFTINWRAERYADRSPMPLAPLEHLQYFPKVSRAVIAQDHGLKLVRLPRHFHLRYGTNWGFRGIVRNIGRTFLLSKMRNYCLYKKI